jgi:hypothetical protein
MLEQQLERIAIALEQIANNTGGVVETPDKKKPGRPAKTAEPAPAEDLLGVDVKPVTQEEVHAALKAFMTKYGIEKTKALMIKNGADQAKPVISSIPLVNYAALMEDIKKG